MCTSGVLTILPGSELDMGWTGIGHDLPLNNGLSLPFRVVRRCLGTQQECRLDSDCGNARCLPTCDCDDPARSVCEIAGPSVVSRCLDHTPCTTNTDCGPYAAECERFLAPIAMNVGYWPLCVVPSFARELGGSVNFATGESVLSAPEMRTRMVLGNSYEHPCPTCGTATDSEVGDVLVCDGGPRNGEPCTVEAVDPIFGATSIDCPPSWTPGIGMSNVLAQGVDLSTGSVSRTAELPCLLPNKCTDDGSACVTNADCLRCTDDLDVCATNADCSPQASCAAAPEQPISCGFYCHCGFCDNVPISEWDNPGRACFADGDCPEGGTCVSHIPNTSRQRLPNGCADFVCGRSDAGTCCNEDLDGTRCPETVSTPLLGACSLPPHVSCTGAPSDLTCEYNSAGECVAERRRPCFEHTITRAGAPSSLGARCVSDPNAPSCASNDDCGAGECTADTSAPKLAQIFCTSRAQGSGVTEGAGVPGPGTLVLETIVRWCRCGDGRTGCDEECDDGNLRNGDSCDQTCRHEDAP